MTRVPRVMLQIVPRDIPAVEERPTAITPQTTVRSAERCHSGGIGRAGCNGNEVDVAGARAKLLKSGRGSQVQAFNKARCFGIDGFQISIDDPLNSIVHAYHTHR
jgi:hypothetical protein